jgi:hypothetical protein
MSEWGEAKPNWILANQQKLMKEGLKVQAAARFIILRLGYDILKAEQEIPSQTQMSMLERKVGNHLARYSDYIVKMDRRIHVIEVKAKEFSYPLAHGDRRFLLFNSSIFLKRSYVDTVAHVLVLAVLYPMGLFGTTSMRGKKVYHTLRSVTGTRTDEGGIEIILDQDMTGYRWTKATTFRKWVKRTKKDAEALIQMHPSHSSSLGST